MPNRRFRQAISIVELREASERLARRRRRLRVAGVGGGVLGVVLIAAVTVVVLGNIRGASAENPVSSGGLFDGSNPRIGVIAHASPSPTPPSVQASTPPAVQGDPPGSSAGQPGTAGQPLSPDPEQLTGYRWPLRGARVTSFFQPRSDGFLVIDGQRVHEGLDIATYCGDTIRAAHDGTVIASGRHFDDQMGFDGPLDQFFHGMADSMWELPIVVIVDDGDGYRSIYAHLGVASVKVGDVVKAGDQLGFEGASGNASGCHLHYELYRTDGPWMKVAPDLVRRDHYPPYEHERIDPFRVLSMNMAGHPTFTPGVNPPRVSPGLTWATVTKRDGH